MMIKKIRRVIFLRDVSILSLTAFGGPQGHIGLFLEIFVKRRGYVSEEELLELFALCQLLPGPTSTQTITALGFKIGGPNLAYLALLIWALPAVMILTTIAVLIHIAQITEVSLNFLRFIEPITVGVVGLSSYRMVRKVVHTKIGYLLVCLSAITSFLLKLPYVFPILILIGGIATTWKYKYQPREKKGKICIQWSNLILWVSVLVGVAILGGLTQWLPLRIFENFYRNGSLIFGGGQVLVPLLYTEFVEFKAYLTSEEFAYGYGLVHAIPGPVFSFSAYVGAISLREFGITYQMMGGAMAALGIFLPGTFLIFFVIRFWAQLKKYRFVKASLEGINAVSAGMVIAAAFLLFIPMESSITNYLLVFGTMGLLLFTKISPFILILLSLVCGLLIA